MRCGKVFGPQKQRLTTFIEEREALTEEDNCALKAAERLRSLVLDSFLVAIHASRTFEGHSRILSAVDIFV